MKTNKLKIAVFATAMLFAGAANAQNTTTDIARAGDGNATKGTVNTAVRVVDNKGTKKYLQVQNGLTTLTNTTPSGGIVTTWQLGGELTDDTYINAEGAVFALDGIELIDTSVIPATPADAAALLPSSNATTLSGTTSSTAPTGTGYTLLVRDEATGATKKLLVSDLLNSSAGEYPVTTLDEGTNTIPPFTLGLTVTDVNRVQVYRNGVKLRGVTGSAAPDYTVTTVGLVSTLTVTATAEWDFYADDIIEYYYAK